MSTIHSVNGNTFHDIEMTQWDAKNGDTIELSGTYLGDGDYIEIYKNITFVGKNDATLDAQNLSNIIVLKDRIGEDLLVVFKNIKFLNSHGTAVDIDHYGNYKGINTFYVVNCTFINNSGEGYDSGAISNPGNCIVVNCTFINNSAKDNSNGGAISSGNAVNCTFINNHANWNGGAISGGNAVNCTFINNTAGQGGGAIYYCDAVNCTFINNTASRGGGAMRFGTAINCTFINNHANENGGAIFNGRDGNAVNCTFINNTAFLGGAISFYGDAVNCTFIGNSANEGNAMDGGQANYCYFGGNSHLETYGTRVRNEIIHASIEITQSGLYYLEKSLTVKLTNLDTNSGVRYEKVKIKFSNGNEITLTADNEGIATYNVTFNPGTYSVTAAPVNDYIQAASKTLNNLKIEKYPASLKLEQVGKDYQDTALRVSLTNTNSNSGIANKRIILTFSNGKTADLKTDSKGIASYDIPFAPGEYKVTGKVDDIKINETSSIDFKINKVSSTIMPTKLTTIYKSGKSFKVRLLNSQTKMPVTGVTLTLNVYTGKKFTTHTLTTDNDGYVYLSTDKLGVGSHKVVVTCNNGYCIGNSATSTIKINSIYPKLTTYTYKTKLGTQLTGKGVMIKDKNSKEPIKGIKVKFKLYTKGKKYKTYTLTTDSLGKCALFTNKYSVGSHKLIITIEIPKIYKNALNKKYKNIKKSTTFNIQSSQKFKLMNNNKYFDILYSNGKVKVA